jgi:hypothetical protein
MRQGQANVSSQPRLAVIDDPLNSAISRCVFWLLNCDLGEFIAIFSTAL